MRLQMGRVSPRHLALAAPRRDRARLAGPPPAARRDLDARGHELRGLGARGAPRCGSASSTTTAPRRRHQLTEHTLGIWHGAIPGVPVGQRYGFRVDGPWDPDHGRRFNPAQAAARPLRPGDQRRASTPGPTLLAYDAAEPARRERPSTPRPRCRARVVVHDEFDWGGDRPLRTRWRDTVIYELHVKGFTQLHNEVPEQLRGTYAGLGSHTVTGYLTTSASPRSSCCRCTSSSPSRPSPTRGHGQLLGLQLDRLLRPARGLLPPRATAASRSPSSSRW